MPASNELLRAIALKISVDSQTSQSSYTDKEVGGAKGEKQLLQAAPKKQLGAVAAPTEENQEEEVNLS